MPTTKKPTGSTSRTKKTAGAKASKSKSSPASSKNGKGSSTKTTKAKTASKSSGAKSSARATKSTTSKAKTASKSSGAKSSARATKSTTSKAKSTKKPSGTTSAPAKKKVTAANRSKATSSRTKAKSGGKGIIATAIDAVAGLFASGSPDAIELLKSDHRKVEQLFEKVKSNEDGNNAATFKKIKQELDLHTHVEETIFYPHLLEKGDKELKKIVREGLEEHGQVKDLLADLTTLSGDSPTFKAKLKVVIENVEHHVKEEEDEMFPMVEDQIPADMRQRLGSLMYGEKVKIGKKSPAPKARKASAGSRG